MRAGDGIWGQKRGVPGLLDQNQQDIATQVGRALSVQGFVPARLDANLELGITAEDFTRPEFWHLRRGRLLGIGNNTPAVAAQLGFVYLQGAAGTLTIIERIEIFNRNAAVQRVAIGFQAAAPAAGFAPIRAPTRDSRVGLTSNPTSTGFSAGNAVGPTVPTTYVSAYIGAGQLWASEVPWVMTGAGVFFTLVNDLTVNQTLDVELYWRERVILETETT